MIYRHIHGRFSLDLREQLVYADADQHQTKNNKRDAKKTGVARMACENALWVISGWWRQRCLQRVVDPLTKADEEPTKRNDRSWNRGECVEQASTGKQKDCNAHDHEHLIPVVEREFGKRIIHCLLGREW